MPSSFVVVIGGSAGCIEPLSTLVSRLPPDLPAAVCITVHFPSSATSQLPRILQRASPLPARHAAPHEELQPGCIYIAPPDRHLLVQAGAIELSAGPHENGHRPAIDPLFRSAAEAYGPNAIGVILSGALDDGTSGLKAIKAQGGTALVQDPTQALFDSMPRSALAHVAVDAALGAAALAAEIERLANRRARRVQPAGPGAAAEKGNDPMGHLNENEQVIVARDKAQLEHGARPNQASMLTCPGCGGVMWELQDGDLLRYRCHLGHAYSADTLAAEQGSALEEALWTALRALEENAALARRLAFRARQGNRRLSAEMFDARAAEQEHRARTLRQLLEREPAALALPESQPDELNQPAGQAPLRQMP